MSDSHVYSLRPLVRPASNPTLEGAFRIHVSPKELKALGLEAGDLCSLNVSDSSAGLGFIWPSFDNNSVTPKRIAKISDLLKDTYGLNYQDKVTISNVEDGLQRVDTVYVTEVGEGSAASNELEVEEIQFWASGCLSRFEAIVAGGTFDIIPRRGQQKPQKRRFLVERVEPGSDTFEAQGSGLSYFDYKSKVAISDSSSVPIPPRRGSRSFHITADRIGGLHKQLEQLNKRLAAFNSNLRRMRLPPHMRRHGAVLLYGLEGTGKSLLLQKLAQNPWKAVIHVDETVVGKYVGQSQASLRKLFARAVANQPSLVVIDKLESLAGNQDSEQQGIAANLVSSLVAELEKVRDLNVLVVAATTRPNDIDKSLRTPSRFRYEIELSIPDANARIEILKVHLDKEKSIHDELCRVIGERTHGFVGSDLGALCEAALEKAVDRYINAIEPNDKLEDKLNPVENEGEASYIDGNAVEIVLDDFETALLDIRPTAMREVFFETPKVKWTDIGGSENVKRALYKVVERPFRYPQIMVDLDLEPQKGILLYGPPGCSKTLTAKAVATEASLNFIAIKGAELISMYVGESERAIREIFRKARAAAPSIIFFDEIDAIASARGGSGSGSGRNGNHSTGSSGTPGLNVLTTLLNEMDGIEHLRGVLVLAATNKPNLLDPALMRPGRFDSLLYIGPPTLAARIQIIKIRTRKMPLADDVDVEALASRMDGYSGAEIVRICVEAAEMTADEREAGDADARVSKRHFELALEKIVRQITPDMVEGYERFRSGR